MWLWLRRMRRRSLARRCRNNSLSLSRLSLRLLYTFRPSALSVAHRTVYLSSSYDPRFALAPLALLYRYAASLSPSRSLSLPPSRLIGRLQLFVMINPSYINSVFDQIYLRASASCSLELDREFECLLRRARTEVDQSDCAIKRCMTFLYGFCASATAVTVTGSCCRLTSVVLFGSSLSSVSLLTSLM
jgi:hypothetical protein